jgi:hypothetical protein
MAIPSGNRRLKYGKISRPKPAAKTHADKPKPPKQTDNNVVAAIAATVIIVLGLAALAVLAYVKTK